MNQQHTAARTRIEISVVSLIAGAGLALSASARAGELVQTEPTPGGIDPSPLIKSVKKSGSSVEIQWKGYAGPYQLQTKSTVSNAWVTRPELLGESTTISAAGDMAICRVLGPTPRYYGATYCNLCHEEHGAYYTQWTNTAHASALQTLASVGQDANPSCLKCHTVGMGFSTGYTNNPSRFSGVQCENCHGPAQQHVEDVFSFTPVASPSALVCGGCHTGEHHPTFDEWQTSGHAGVVEDMSPTNRISSCGRCHSGSARLALLQGQDPAVTATNDANVAITCVVCHDPHSNHAWTNVMTGVVYTNQLRQVLSSTNDFFLTTSDNFTAKYNPNVNLCAQCHNHRGASWSSTSRPPHHSPQYNMLLGTVGVLPDGVSGGAAAHAGTRFLEDGTGRRLLVTNQCVTCHMQTHPYQYGPPEVAAITGHKFAVTSYGVCVDCHGSGANAEGLVQLVRGIVTEEIQEVQGLLNTWAATKAPAALYSKYGTRAWEYTNPGELSPGGAGPSTAEQALIPDSIKKARFDLYLVLYDGSYGVHNGPHALTLLDSARGWVQQELSK